jgi:phenylalanyl-tRNA synthetase alpha chain
VKDINKIKKEAIEEIKAIQDTNALEAIRIKYLGKRGVIRQISSDISKLSDQEKKEFGLQINSLKETIETQLSTLNSQFSTKIPNQLSCVDIESLPGIKPEIGHLHLITQAIREVTDIFKPLGFKRVRYPEVEWEYYAFDALNMGKDEPARDEWETFFLDAPLNSEKGRMVITPHTSSGQVQEMLKGNLPIRMLNISRCGRRQVDISHNPTFYQFEGLVVDKGINITHLKGVLDYFAKNFFGGSREIRLRPYDFRFTEPSFEVDISCGLCLGKGCKTCKEGWMELGGAGMVHPNVLKAGKINPEEYTGFAFGWGEERTYMMKSGTKIDDIRLLFGNDLRFLDQF